MRHGIQSIQASQIVCWRAVNEPAVFAPEEEMVSEVNIGSSPVYESRPGLRVRPCQVLRIEDQSARAGKHKGRPMLHGHTEDISCRDFMRIGIPPKSGVGLRI